MCTARTHTVGEITYKNYKNTSNILDHILANSTDKIFEVGTMDIGLSDHQLIYSTRKQIKEKTHTKTYIKYRSLKNYQPDILIKK